jgi:hypothetical protein
MVSDELFQPSPSLPQFLLVHFSPAASPPPITANDRLPCIMSFVPLFLLCCPSPDCLALCPSSPSSCFGIRPPPLVVSSAAWSTCIVRHPLMISGVGYVWGEGGKERGVGQNACTRSCVEVYRGKVGAKNAFLPQKCTENPPKIPPLKSGTGLGCVTVLYCDITPRWPPGDAPGEGVCYMAPIWFPLILYSIVDIHVFLIIIPFDAYIWSHLI